jgi:hypothetical protein
VTVVRFVLAGLVIGGLDWDEFVESTRGELTPSAARHAAAELINATTPIVATMQVLQLIAAMRWRLNRLAVMS